MKSKAYYAGAKYRQEHPETPLDELGALIDLAFEQGFKTQDDGFDWAEGYTDADTPAAIEEELDTTVMSEEELRDELENDGRNR